MNMNDGLNHDDPGLLQFKDKLPFRMTRKQEQELLEEARRRRTVLLTNDCESVGADWYHRANYHGVHVTSKKQNPFCITKGVTQAPAGMTLEHVRQQYACDFGSAERVSRLFQRIDPMNIHMATVSELQHKDLLEENGNKESLRVFWGAFYVKPFISDRDFLFCMHTSITTCPVTHQEVFCTNSFSMDWPDVVPDLQAETGRVRATIQLTGYTFRPSPDDDNNSLQIAFLGQCDPQGWLPPAVVNFASVSQAMNVGRVRDGYQHLYDVAKRQFQLPDYVPMAHYAIPRRGGGAVHQITLPSSGSDGNKAFTIRLLAHCDHAIAMTLPHQEGTNSRMFTLDVLKVKDKEKRQKATQLLDGKTITFGGNKTTDAVLDITLQVTVTDNDTPAPGVLELELVFINHGWKRATLCLPETPEIGTADVDTQNQETATEQLVEQ